MTLEEIIAKYESDTLNIAFVPYVKPLVERIRELELEKKCLCEAYTRALQDLPYDD